MSILVSGAGTSAINGTYVGAPSDWGNGSYHISVQDGHCEIRDNANTVNYYYTGPTSPCDDELSVVAGTWLQGDGSLPVPTFSIVSSGGGTSTSATTTQALIGSTNFGIAIIIVLLSLILVGFLGTIMKTKKPWK